MKILILILYSIAMVHFANAEQIPFSVEAKKSGQGYIFKIKNTGLTRVFLSDPRHSTWGISYISPDRTTTKSFGGRGVNSEPWRRLVCIFAKRKRDTTEEKHIHLFEVPELDLDFSKATTLSMVLSFCQCDEFTTNAFKMIWVPVTFVDEFSVEKNED